MDFANRHDQFTAMPTSNDGYRNVKQLGQHRRSVELDIRFVEQTESLPELGFRDDFQFAFSCRFPNRLVEQGVFFER